MSFTLLLPHDIAKRCYLDEALFWVALQRFPLASITEKGIDEREDQEYIEGLEPRIPFESPVTDEECRRVGLEQNPEYRDFADETYHSLPEHIRTLLRIHPLPEDDRVRLERELEEAIQFHRQQAVWESDFSAFVEVHKAKLFLEFREGRLGVVGKRLPRRTFTGSARNLEATNWRGWDSCTWDPIPADFWLFKKINWSESYAEGRNAAYALILVDTEMLFHCFPPPDPEHFGGVAKIANDLVLIKDKSPTHRAAIRGRPPFRWDEFHLELAKRLRNGDVPAKQEAFITEMQTWCEARWHRKVGRSTLLQKVKPYYDAFLRVSKIPRE
jgi:hypothetical protein